jgi:uncharacterized repeat protein (TIGR03803 family)
LRFVTTLVGLLAALVGALLPNVVTPTSAQVLPTYQQLMSFGNTGAAAVPATGNHPEAGLILGTDGALYGVTEGGGSLGGGTVFKVNSEGTDFTVLKDLDRSTGWLRLISGELIQGRDGALYGTATVVGETYLRGTVFKLNPDGTGFTVLLNFDDSDSGNAPTAGVIEGTDGVLYGTTFSGGSHGYGTVFRLNTDGTGFTVLKTFDGTGDDGYALEVELLHATDGALYGTATLGGLYGSGTIYKLNTDGTGFTVLVNLEHDTMGARPSGRLIQGADGALYGVANAGGSHSEGTIFRLNPDGTDFTVLVNLQSSQTGSGPNGLIQGNDGMLYGTASGGGINGNGTVFRVNPDGTGFSVLRELDSATTGSHPFSPLVQGPDGMIYGTASRGGANDLGTLFRLNSDGSGFAVIKHLSHEIPATGPDRSETGGWPLAGLIQEPNGTLYGTAYNGGSNDGGTVFRLNPDGTDFSVLLHFDHSITGGGPRGALLLASDGSLYGTCAEGGTHEAGTVFKINPDGTGLSVLHHFDRYTTPYAELIQLPDGMLYGTTLGGGDFFAGTIFRLNPDGSGFTVLVSFNYDTTGGYPDAALLLGSDGGLYGTTLNGGIHGYGTIYRLNPDGSGFSVLKDLNSTTTGGGPFAKLVQGTDGALYGTTSEGGSGGYGTVFKLNTDGTGFTVLKSFDNAASGGGLEAELMQGTDGALYGTTWGGGAFNWGTVYRLNPDGSDFTVLQHLDYSRTGGGPVSGLMQGLDGAIYGTTFEGGDATFGTVFRLVFNSLSISGLTPPLVISGSGAFTLTVNGFDFSSGAVVQWNGANLDTTFVSRSQVTAVVASVPTTSDIYTALITVKNPDEAVSPPAVFTVVAANVAEVESGVATEGDSVTVSTAPIGTGNSAGITATADNAGDPSPLTVSVAIYDSNPSPSTAFGLDTDSGVAGEFMDLQVTGADVEDTLAASFYYPIGTLESGTSPTLRYYDGAAWVDVVSSGGAVPVKDTTDNLDGTDSGGRLGVLFDNTSTPRITELGGTFFAITFPRPPLGFTGFLAPIGGADATGGSFTNPVRTFKGGSTIPVKFQIARDGVAVVSGMHRLRAIQASDETAAGTPIDATPQDGATAGNAFVLRGNEWHFNLDTKATGITTGIWKLIATLSDGSQHHVWMQIK